MPINDGMIGQLFTVQAGSFAANLTTIPGIGIRPVANGIYSCFAENNNTNDNEIVTITVLGWLLLS